MEATWSGGRVAMQSGLAALLLLLAAGCADHSPAQDPPPRRSTPELAAYVSAQQIEVNEARVVCFREHGLAASVDPDGGVTIAGGTDDTARMFEINQTCEERLIERGILEPEPTDAEAFYRELCDFYLTLIACLEGEGYAVPDPPTIDTFVSTNGEWNPYSFVQVTAGSDVKARCPETWRAW